MPDTEQENSALLFFPFLVSTLMACGGHSDHWTGQIDPFCERKLSCYFFVAFYFIFYISNVMKILFFFVLISYATKGCLLHSTTLMVCMVFCYIALTLHVNNNDLPNHLPCEKAEISLVSYLFLCSVMSGSLYWATHRQQGQRNGK